MTNNKKSIEVMVSKTKKCPACGSALPSKTNMNEIFKKFEVIVKSRKDAYEKKIALFNCIKDIKLEDLEPLEKKRIDYLLQGRLYNELAKESMKEYKKLTVEDYTEQSNKFKDMTSILIERDICHQCEISKPYKELATCKNDEGRTVFYSPITCLDCYKKKDFVE